MVLSSSENLGPWTNRPVAFSDDWFSEAYARDDETLTKALQMSSEPETPPARPNRRASGPSGKVSKRKARAAKRSQTTFINADPANFRQMVHLVTGVRFSAGGYQVAAGPLVKPELQSLVHGLVPLGCLPTLDTSAFFMDRYQRDMDGVPAGPVDFSPEPVLVPEPVGRMGPGVGLILKLFLAFPL